MIIKCENCSRKFIVKDKDIPKLGRTVQCGFCSVTWHQLPIIRLVEPVSKKSEIGTITKQSNENFDNEVEASDGQTYKIVGNQWARILPSGKTGLFAKKAISKELNKLTGRKEISKTKKKIKNLNPSSEKINSGQRLPEIYKHKEGIGFFGYIFLIFIVSLSTIGIIKTFEDDWLNYFPQDQYIFNLLDEQLEYITETFKNIITIAKDLIKSY
jgi:predicted Zn finger-like uncharacterized protein